MLNVMWKELGFTFRFNDEYIDEMGCYERRSEAFYIAENDAMIIQFNLLSKSLVIANKMSDLSNHTIISDKVLDAIMSTRKIINNHSYEELIECKII